KLARVATNSANIDFKGSDFPALIHKELAVDEDYDRIKPLDYLSEVEWIIAVGADFVKTHQVVAKIVYQEVRSNKPLIVLGEVGENLQRWATEYVPVVSKDLEKFVAKLAEQDVKLPGIDASQAERIIEITRNGKGAILLGTKILESPEPEKVLRSLVRAAGPDGTLIPLYPFGNEVGVIKAGLRPEFLPGPSSVTVSETSALVEKAWGGGNLDDGLDLSEMRRKAEKGEFDVLYVADGSIPVEGFENVPIIIYQSPYPSDWMNKASVILPSTTFVEENGTFVNLEGRVLKLHAIAKPPGNAKEDWKIFSEIGGKIVNDQFSFADSNEILDELSRYTRSIEVGGQRRRNSWTPATSEESKWYPTYRGATIAERIEDLARFIEKLPERDTHPSEMPLEELVKHVERERKRQSKEAI
ncbi:MAG: molybdopterin-dependent oxidoreductase, partial [Candidatus Thorarchaeota archaeon]